MLDGAMTTATVRTGGYRANETKDEAVKSGPSSQNYAHGLLEVDAAKMLDD